MSQTINHAERLSSSSYFYQGEGVAYRGRVLMELTTKLVDKPEHRTEDISSDDLLTVEVGQNKDMNLFM